MAIKKSKVMDLGDGKLLYDDLRNRIENIDVAEDIIVVQDETPTNPDTVIWLPETQPESVQVATYAELTAVQEAVPDASAIAPDYSDLTFPVAAGTPCMHDGLLYKANQEISASETWTAAHWDATSVASENSDLKTAINSTEGRVDDIEEAISKTVKSKNLINPDNLVVGRLNSSGNVDEARTNYRTSDYILLDPGSYVFAREKLADGSALTMSYSGYCLYDLTKNYISDSRVYDNWPSGTVLSITIANQCYIRITGDKGFFTNSSPGVDTGLYILQAGTALDGYEAWFTPYDVIIALTENDIVQASGQNTDKVMSQKAVTDLVNSIEPEVPQKLEDVEDAFSYVVGKNKYDKDSCNPQDNYLYDSTTGAISAGSNYAISGKIPVLANTQYTFSSTVFSTTYAKVCYFSGDSGETYISRGDSGELTFTTPANCTFIGVQLFSRTHDTNDFNNAISSAQLELGNEATIYEAYKETITLASENVENGEKLDALGSVMTTQSLVNLYDKRRALDGCYFYSAGETIQESANYAFSGMIPVKPNTEYSISRDPSAELVMSGVVFQFDAAGGYIGAASLSNYVYSYLNAFATGSTTHFVAFNMSKTSHTEQEFNDTIDTIMMCYGTLRPLQYVPYQEVEALNHHYFDNAYRLNADCFNGKKWLAIGTSITWYDGKTYQNGLHTDEICRGYIGYVSRRKGLCVTNEGISGATLALTTSDSALINRYQDLDWANTDIATLEFGVNDYGHAIAIGTENDAPGTTTFAACLKTVIEYALAQNPKICLVICTEPDVRGSTANSDSHYLWEYTDVTLAIAKQYRLPVCDWYYHSGISALTKGSSSLDYMTADGTHPNDDGHMRMGAMLNQVFDSLIC